MVQREAVEGKYVVRELDTDPYVTARNHCQALAEQFAAVLKGLDALVTPTMATSLRSSNGRTTSSPTAYSTPQSPTASTTPAKSEPLINGSSSSQSPCRRRASQELILAAYIYV